MKQSNEWQCGSFFGICLFLPHSSFSLFSSFSTIGITVRWETKSWPYSPVHNMIFSQEPRDALPWKFNILCRWLWKRAVRDSWRHHTLLQVMQLDQETWRRYLAFWTGETNFYISLASLYVGKVFLKQGCGKKCGHQAQQEEDRMQVNLKKYFLKYQEQDLLLMDFTEKEHCPKINANLLRSDGNEVFLPFSFLEKHFEARPESMYLLCFSLLNHNKKWPFLLCSDERRDGGWSRVWNLRILWQGFHSKVTALTLCWFLKVNVCFFESQFETQLASTTDTFGIGRQ